MGWFPRLLSTSVVPSPVHHTFSTLFRFPESRHKPARLHDACCHISEAKNIYWIHTDSSCSATLGVKSLVISGKFNNKEIGTRTTICNPHAPPAMSPNTPLKNSAWHFYHKLTISMPRQNNMLCMFHLSVVRTCPSCSWRNPSVIRHRTYKMSQEFQSDSLNTRP